MQAILGKKIEMTQIFDEEGNLIPVTVVEAGPCQVIEVKTKEKHGYHAVQLGYVDKARNTSKPLLGHFKKHNATPKKQVKEIRLEAPAEVESGAKITCEIFEEGARVDVTGISKGRGWAGTIKRHNFKIGPQSHGGMNKRRPGAIGQCAYPSRVFKGKKMAGQMGNKTCTTRGLAVVRVDPVRNILLIKGAVPGPNGGYLKIKKAVY